MPIRDAVDRINAARKAASEALDRFQAEDERNRTHYQDFYNRLMLLSGGTMALSLTYLGYLRTSQLTVHASQLLVASWIALLACLLLALFAPFSFSFYRHYHSQSELSSKMAIKYEVECAELPLVPQYPPLTLEEIGAQQKELKRAAEQKRADSAWAKRWADLHWSIWKWGGILARFAILIGMICLFGFAIMNLQGSLVPSLPVKKP